MLPALQRQFSCVFVSLIESTVREIELRSIKSVGVLASPTTLRTMLYQMPLETLGIQVRTPNPKQTEIIESAIRAVIAGADLRPHRAKVTGILNEMILQGSEAVLLGCTELSVLLPDIDVRQIDPLHIIPGVLLKNDVSDHGTRRHNGNFAS